MAELPSLTTSIRSSAATGIWMDSVKVLAAPLGTTRRPSTSVSVAEVPSPRRLIALPCVELPP